MGSRFVETRKSIFRGPLLSLIKKESFDLSIYNKTITATTKTASMRLSIPTIALLYLSNAWGFAPNPEKSFRTALKASNANEINPMKKGSSCALVTPFLPNGEIDVPSLKNLLTHHLEHETDNLCILGTTGEASVLSMDERALVLGTAVDMVKGEIPILAGVGTIDPQHVKEMTQQAIDIGCDAALVVTPYYVKPPQRGLINHMNTIADLGLPLVIYNIPGRTKVDMTDESIAVCAEHENIIGLKDATGDLDRVQSLRNLVGNDFLMYSGDDGTSIDFVNLGGDGCISVTANCAPKCMHDAMMAVLRGDKEEADQINERLKLLHKRLFCESNPIPAKWAVKQMGLIKHAHCRPPLDEMDPKFEKDVEEALKAAGLTIAREGLLTKEVFDKMMAGKKETEKQQQVSFH